MGSYGEAKIVFRGYSASLPINIGEYKEPEDEAQLFRETEEEYLGRIRAAAPVLEQVYRHYAEATHRYARHRGWLDRDRGVEGIYDYRNRFRLPRSQKQPVPLGGIEMSVFLTSEKADAVLDKVVADVQLSQLSGGPLAPYYEEARTLPMPDRPIATVLGELLEYGYAPAVVSTLLELAFGRPKALRSLAEAGPPAPRLAALALVSALDGIPIPTAAFDLLHDVENPSLKQGAGMTLQRLLPDAQWEAGTARIAEVISGSR